MSVTLRNNSWPGLTVQWSHYIGKGGNAGMGAAFGHETGNQATLAIQVYDADLENAIWEILGTNAMVGGKLSRNIPIRHPVFPWLYATRISGSQPIGWNAKDSTGGIAHSTYKVWVLTILFTQPRYTVLSDSDLARLHGGLEQFRYVEVNEQASGDVLTREGNTFIYAEGTGTPEPTANSTKVNTPTAMFLAKKEFLVKWVNVPLVGARNNNGEDLKSTYQDAILGAVNDATFMGCSAGTLLLKSYRLNVHEAPYSAVTQGLAASSGRPSLEADFEFCMAYFDPPGKGTYFGHNLLPYAAQKKFFLATADGTAIGDGLFKTASFANLFLLNA